MQTNQAFKSMLATLVMGISFSAVAADYAAIDKSACQTKINTTEPFILLLKSGDHLHDSINQCAADAQLKGASIHGLGQFSNPTFAYYSSDPHEKPRFTTFNGIYELIALNGNVAMSGHHYYSHIHAVLGNEQFQALAGHIKDTQIGVTAEILIVPLTKSLVRNVDPETGFGPIVTD